METSVNPQAELPLLGDAKRRMHQHTLAEIRICRSMADACRVALGHSQLTQETAAERLAISRGYMSLLLSGKKRWTDDLQWRFEQITGSLAPTQWDVARKGLSVYVDEVEVRKARLRAELNALDRAA